MKLKGQKTILLVEDDDSTAMLETEILKEYGFNVVRLDTGEKAVEFFAAVSDIDLVLMDINLGGGIDGTKAAEAMLLIREIPVIFLSSHTEREIVEKMEGITSYGYIVKNSGETVLIASIKMAFRLFESRLKENESAAFRERVFESSRVPIIVMDPVTFEYIECNSAAVEIYRFSSREEILNKKQPVDVSPMTQYDGSSSAEKARYFVNKALAEGSVVFEWKHRRPDGELWDAEVHLMSFQAGGRQLLQFTLMDITERKKAERALRESEARFRTLFENAGDAIIIMDQNVFLECNEKALELFGCTRDQFIGRPPYELSPPIQPDGRSSKEKAKEKIAAAVAGNSQFFEWVHSRHDGTSFEAEVSLNAISVNYGTLIQAIVRDITGRKLTEEKLRESEARYRFISENTADVIWTLSMKTGKFTYVSSSVQKMRGYTPEEVMDQTMSEALTPESLQKATSLLREGIANRKAEESNYYRSITQVDQPCKDGSVVSTEAATTIVFDKHGQPVEIIGVSRDITERRKTEEKIKASLLEKEVLLRELHHRTKNNMQVICAMLVMYSLKTDRPELKNIFREIETRIHSMALVHQKLYKSKDLSNINLYEYVMELTGLLMKSYNMTVDRISLELNIENTAVLIDVAIPCGLILNELFSNSFKYAFPGERRGKIFLSMAAREQNIDLNYSDDGVGLPENFDYRNDGKIGMQSVVSIIEEQLLGSVSITSKNGFHCDASFKNTLYRIRI